MTEPAEGPVGPPRVGLPEPLDRRLRLGPFPSAREALKFATWAAVGALVASFAGAVFWLPFLGGGFLLAVYRPDGKGLDDRVGDRCAYHLRALAGPARTPATGGRPASGALARAGNGRLVAVVAAGGIPVAFLPPVESHRLFEGFRDLLAGLGEGLFLVATTEPLGAAPFLPAPAPAGRPDSAALGGYREMVTLLCRRRYRRRVLLVVYEAGTGAEAIARLEARATGLVESLERLGLVAERLRDRALAAALRQIGWDRGSAR